MKTVNHFIELSVMLSVWAALLELMYVVITTTTLNGFERIVILILLSLCLPSKISVCDDGKTGIQRIADAAKDDKTKDKEEN